MYKLTLRIDDQLRQYLQDIFHSSDLERNEVLQLMMFYGSKSKDFQDFIRNYVTTSPPPSLEEGLGTWILAKKTHERIEGEDCRHDTPLFRGNTRGKVTQGNRVLPRNEARQQQPITRLQGEVRNGGNGNGNDRRLPNPNRTNATIKINF